MRQLKFGKSKLEFQKTEFNDEEWQITFGQWESQAHVDLVQKSILIEEVPTVKKVVQLQMRIAI